MHRVNAQPSIPVTDTSGQSTPSAPPRLTINSQDEARGYVAALDLRFKDQFTGALSQLAEKVTKGVLDESSYLLLTRAMVDANKTAQER
ncbi:MULTISPECIES: hypothetical protein [Pseudomonas]|uniref:hypothetical protein n=1 Tax=Pseudomonas TaxID=286 RepID=UPI000CFA9AB7|nr:MULTISPECIES: hypothetical protein [Pseudomonas]PQZ94420.1 hypothetical protein CQ048_05015 [Pseudomonas trivialis]PRB29474.1 hypothetical protein CQ041_05020 [Pseudomonas sp. MYb60]